MQCRMAKPNSFRMNPRCIDGHNIKHNIRVCVCVYDVITVKVQGGYTGNNGQLERMYLNFSPG